MPFKMKAKFFKLDRSRHQRGQDEFDDIATSSARPPIKRDLDKGCSLDLDYDLPMKELLNSRKYLQVERAQPVSIVPDAGHKALFQTQRNYFEIIKELKAGPEGRNIIFIPKESGVYITRNGKIYPGAAPATAHAQSSTARMDKVREARQAEIDLMLDGGVEGKGSKDAVFAMILVLVILYAVVIVSAYVFFIQLDAEDEFYFFI